MPGEVLLHQRDRQQTMLAAGESILTINKLQAPTIELLQSRSLRKEVSIQVYRSISWQQLQYTIPSINSVKNKTGTKVAD